MPIFISIPIKSSCFKYFSVMSKRTDEVLTVYVFVPGASIKRIRMDTRVTLKYLFKLCPAGGAFSLVHKGMRLRPEDTLVKTDIRDKDVIVLCDTEDLTYWLALTVRRDFIDMMDMTTSMSNSQAAFNKDLAIKRMMMKDKKKNIFLDLRPPTSAIKKQSDKGFNLQMDYKKGISNIPLELF